MLGVLLSDFLDVDAAHVAEDDQRALGATVVGDGGVVLLVDRPLLLDEHADGCKAVDLQFEDLRGVIAGFLGGVGELDAAGLHPAAAEDLRFDDDRTAELRGGLGGLFGGGRELPFRERDTVAGEDLLRFVLVEPHARPPRSGGAHCATAAG